MRRNRGYQEERRQARYERRDIKGEGRGHAGHGDEKAGEDGPGNRDRLAAQPADGDGRGQALARDEARQGRRASRLVNRPYAGGHERHHVKGPDGWLRLGGDHGQREATAGQQYLGDDEKAAPVHRIRDGSAGEGEDDDRCQLDEGQQTDGQRAVGELPQLERQGHDRDLATYAADELAQPDHSEVAVALQRFKVDEEASQAMPLLVGGLGHAGKDMRAGAYFGGAASRSRTTDTQPNQTRRLRRDAHSNIGTVQTSGRSRILASASTGW